VGRDMRSCAGMKGGEARVLGSLGKRLWNSAVHNAVTEGTEWVFALRSRGRGLPRRSEARVLLVKSRCNWTSIDPQHTAGP